ETFDAQAPVPPDHARWDFVADREHENTRVATELTHRPRQIAANLTLQAEIVEECHVLGPGKSNEHSQAVLCSFVKQVGSWRRIRADGVYAELRHQTEVLGNLTAVRELIPIRVRGERPVRHTFDEKPFVASAQK